MCFISNRVPDMLHVLLVDVHMLFFCEMVVYICFFFCEVDVYMLYVLICCIVPFQDLSLQ